MTKRNLQDGSTTTCLREKIATKKKVQQDHEDEELTSVEDHEEHAFDSNTVEQTMLTVALVRSVVEKNTTTTSTATDHEESSDEGNSKAGTRYALRRKRQRTGQDAERLENGAQFNKEGYALDVTGSSSTAPIPLNKQYSVPNPLEDLPEEDKSSTMGLKVTVKREEEADRADQRGRPQQPLNPSSVSNVTANPLRVTSSTSNPISESNKNERVDTSGLNLVDTGLDHSQQSQEKEDDEVGSRPRGYSIDLDSLLELPQEGRNRAFSFECFTFGINPDEQLPPLLSNDTSTNFSRLRGDSIIFDPSSFRDGGIHEQNALVQTTTADNDATAGPQLLPTIHETAVTGLLPPPGRPDSFDLSGTLTSAPYHLSSKSSATIVVHSHSTQQPSDKSEAFSMDLLNKGGRIGMYLPDARRERIARFHAKRAKRIWRKRIKYDCRKKLADSRPRIKGRFVKRTDVN